MTSRVWDTLAGRVDAAGDWSVAPGRTALALALEFELALVIAWELDGGQMDTTGARRRSGGPTVWARWARRTNAAGRLRRDRYRAVPRGQVARFDPSEAGLLDGHPALGAGNVFARNICSRLPGREVASVASHRLTWRDSTLSSAARVAAEAAVGATLESRSSRVGRVCRDCRRSRCAFMIGLRWDGSQVSAGS